jgi:hypothetical protein
MIWRASAELGVGRALMPVEHRCTNVQCSRAVGEAVAAMNKHDRFAVVVCLYKCVRAHIVK